MKKLLLPLLLVFALFTACSSDDDNSGGDNKEYKIVFFDQSDSNTEIKEATLLLSLSEYLVEIKGGDGTYSYDADDTTIINLSTVVSGGREYMSIKPLKAGSTQIKVNDSLGNKATLPIIITTSSTQGSIVSSTIEIVTDDDLIKATIEEDAKEGRLEVGTYFEFKFQQYINSGDLIVYPEGKDKELRYEGVFAIMPSPEGNNLMSMTYNDKTYVYLMGNPDNGRSLKYDVPSDIANVILIEDLTEKYKEKYSSANIESVKAKAHFIINSNQ